ncbi:MAG: hypothetical protein R3E42_13695 [Burkholderiaceae bacterium]
MQRPLERVHRAGNGFAGRQPAPARGAGDLSHQRLLGHGGGGGAASRIMAVEPGDVDFRDPGAPEAQAVICQTGCVGHAHPWLAPDGQCRRSGDACERIGIADSKG